ncbi:uncharacterized protein LOC110863590 [Folsomia candida]|uniref:Regulator of G-protein signaling 7-binding protein n=1 Tax=Folsomia candida TaxID=158441 RepID=A0A226F2N9_FOLCA|nr:uncharacterized protein LOC110863590 [Folsomia candida]XP_035713506.1 uncharacterized protein LOC110863590 [Folsomia candida]XP_035713510.1 uncharacterized protein LOC110863590 [Folsomia candida]OXA63206.1 Regulator of G-protein signaling 7-binding protein [Folsomia candida]
MDSLQTLEEMEQEQSQVGQAESHTNMQLLSVPGSASPGGGSTGGLGTCNVRDSKFMRRYSCNPQGKGTPHPGHLEPTPSSSSPSMMRRSSLAAIKWSVLARRISMGLAHDREPPEDPTKAIADVNTKVATLRDLLIHIGQPRDGPEMRENIRRVRRQTIESCRHAVQIILNQIHNDIADGMVPMDFSPQLVLLFFCTQLLLKELRKCKRLVLKLPINMEGYYDSRPGPAGPNFAAALSQIILCRQINPDFNQEELCSIDKDTGEISSLLDDLQEFMPMNENSQVEGYTYEEVFGRRSRRRRRNSWCDFQSLCCTKSLS